VFSYMKQGSGFYREVARLASPIMLQYVITNTLGLADTFMVGLLGEAPMAAVALANIPLFVVMLFFFGSQSGSMVLFSQYWGRKDLDSINRVAGVAMYAVLGASLAVAAVLWFYPVQFLGLFNNDPEVVHLAAQYGRLAGLSYVFDSVCMIYLAAYRSMEQPKLGTWILGASMLVNTFLNWVFIFGNLGAPELGVEGAALATLIARILELLIVLGHSVTTKGYRLKPALLLRPGRDMVRRFLKFASPVVVNETLWGMGYSAVPAIMGHMAGSTEILAAYTVANNMEKLVLAAGSGLAGTAAILVGREIGAGRSRDEVYPKALAMSALGGISGVVVGILLWLFTWFVARPWMFPLLKLSDHTAAIVLLMMALMCTVMPIRNLSRVNATGILRGGGDVTAAMYIELIPLWVFAIPYAAVCGLVLDLGIEWVYLVFWVEQIVKTIMSVHRLRSKKWIRDITRD